MMVLGMVWWMVFITLLEDFTLRNKNNNGITNIFTYLIRIIYGTKRTKLCMALFVVAMLESSSEFGLKVAAMLTTDLTSNYHSGRIHIRP